MNSRGSKTESQYSAEINAAGTISALVFSQLFDLKCTYFLIAGIAGIDPNVGSTGSVTFARFEVQVALQYEFDIRELGNNFSTGYIPFGAKEPLAYPVFIYGTEVFEINDALRQKVKNGPLRYIAPLTTIENPMLIPASLRQLITLVRRNSTIP